MADVTTAASSQSLLIFDGHDSHISLDVVEMAEAHKIYLLQMPSHSSHRLQMLDLTCFGPLHNHLGKAMHAYRVLHPREPLTRANLSAILGPPFKKALSASNIIAGFHAGMDRAKMMSKLSRNAVDTPLTPLAAVVIDQHPVRGLLEAINAATPVTPSPAKLTPSSLLHKKSRLSLENRVHQLEKALHDSETARGRVERDRALGALRPPGPTSTTTPARRRWHHRSDRSVYCARRMGQHEW